jgi:hypothetical protein
MMNLSWSGRHLIRRQHTRQLMEHDLPAPVEPASSRCGSCARSSTTGSPDMSLPTAMVSRLWGATGPSDSMMSPISTESLMWLGTSMPMACLPGMGE